jgi:hypothetical protein
VSTDLCTARLDDAAGPHQTVYPARHYDIDDGPLPLTGGRRYCSEGKPKGGRFGAETTPW